MIILAIFIAMLYICKRNQQYSRFDYQSENVNPQM